MEIRKEFPTYIENIVLKEIKNIGLAQELQIPIKYLFPDDSQESLYEFLERTQLKFFTKLIARPMTVTLKHILEEDEKDKVRDDLYHVFDIQFWHNNLKIRLKNNWNEIYKEWMTY